MRNKNKNKVFNKIISVALSLIMTISLLPTSTYADSMGNLITGTGAAPGAGGLNSKWAGFGDIFGYKISVWYAPNVGYDDNKNPIYGWGTGKEYQVGKTVHWRKNHLTYNFDYIDTKDSYGHRYFEVTGEQRSPSFWCNQSIYTQISQGKYESSWYNPDSNSYFSYNLIRNLGDYAWALDDAGVIDWGGDITILDENGTPKQSAKFEGMIPIFNKYHDVLVNMKEKGLDDTYGYKQLYDYLSRLFDMPQTRRDNSYDLSTLTIERLEGQGTSADRMRAENFILPFAQSTKDTEWKSSEYIKSYFLNPVVFNIIAQTTGGDWNWENFITGAHREYTNGQFKVFLEPEISRFLNGKAGVASWRDVIYDTISYDSLGLLSDGGGYSQIANALMLENEETILKYDGDNYLGQNGYRTNAITSEEYGTPTAGKEINSTLGVGILTSPSLNDYIDPDPGTVVKPKVIKNYVEIESVDSAGNITYRTVHQTVEEDAEFRVAVDAEEANILGASVGEESQVPQINQEETIEGIKDGKSQLFQAYLNDVITVGANVTVRIFQSYQ